MVLVGVRMCWSTFYVNGKLLCMLFTLRTFLDRQGNRYSREITSLSIRQKYSFTWIITKSLQRAPLMSSRLGVNGLMEIKSKSQFHLNWTKMHGYFIMVYFHTVTRLLNPTLQIHENTDIKYEKSYFLYHIYKKGIYIYINIAGFSKILIRVVKVFFVTLTILGIRIHRKKHENYNKFKIAIKLNNSPILPKCVHFLPYDRFFMICHCQNCYGCSVYNVPPNSTSWFKYNQTCW